MVYGIKKWIVSICVYLCECVQVKDFMSLLHEKKRKSMKDFSMGNVCEKEIEACVAFLELIDLTSPCIFLMKLIIVMDSRFSQIFVRASLSSIIFTIHWFLAIRYLKFIEFKIGSWRSHHISHYSAFFRHSRRNS
jgi:hypothetical protein